MTGSDQIGDTPYEIDQDNADRYPLMKPIDHQPPTISLPTRTPSGNVNPEDQVKISVNVTDLLSGVNNVTLIYTTDNGTNWHSQLMNLNASTGLYDATLLLKRLEP